MKKNRKARQPKQPRPTPSPFGEFSNHAVLRYGLNEVTIEFTRTRPGGSGEDWPSEDACKVTIPLAVAKCLIYNLTAFVAILEGAIGTIPVPPVQRPQLAVNAAVMSPDLIARLITSHSDLFGRQVTPRPAIEPQVVDPVPDEDMFNRFAVSSTPEGAAAVEPKAGRKRERKPPTYH